MNFCKDCKHMHAEPFSLPCDWRCTAVSQPGRLTYLTGRAVYPYCHALRSADECGPDGKLFEARKES